MNRTLKYALPVVAFAVLAGFLLVGLGRKPSEIPSPLIGKPAPVWSLPALPSPASKPPAQVAGSGATPAPGPTAPVDGAMIDSASLVGRPYLLNVWASWCLPCLQEHPLLLDLARQKVLPIVGFNYKDRPEDALAWLKRHGDPFDRIAVDREGRVAIDFGVYGVPESFLIDAGGIIRFKWIGPLTPEAVRDQLLPAIRALPPATAARSGA